MTTHKNVFANLMSDDSDDGKKKKKGTFYIFFCFLDSKDE